MNIYKVELNFPLDPNIESYLYSQDIFIVENPAPKYGVTELIIKTKRRKEELESMTDIKRVIQ